MRWLMCLVLTLAGCSSEERAHAPLQHGMGGSGGQAAAASSAATGGQGGEPTDAGCDAWADEGCCAPSTFCKEGSLGPCQVDVKLCEGECAGTPTPVPNTKCGDGGVCAEGACAYPDAG